MSKTYESIMKGLQEAVADAAREKKLPRKVITLNLNTSHSDEGGKQSSKKSDS